MAYTNKRLPFKHGDRKTFALWAGLAESTVSTWGKHDNTPDYAHILYRVWKEETAQSTSEDTEIANAMRLLARIIKEA